MAALFWNISIRLANSQRCRLRLVAEAAAPLSPIQHPPDPPEHRTLPFIRPAGSRRMGNNPVGQAAEGEALHPDFSVTAQGGKKTSLAV
jgi:hypothetical protein